MPDENILHHSCPQVLELIARTNQLKIKQHFSNAIVFVLVCVCVKREMASVEVSLSVSIVTYLPG